MNKSGLSIKWFETGIKNSDSIDWALVMEIYRKHAKETSRVVEIGASIKDRTAQLGALCESLFGVEVVPERLPQNFNNVKYILGDWQKLSSLFETEFFDIAVASHVIEHVENDVIALTELYKVMRPGAVAIISTPNKDRLAARLSDLIKGKRKFPWYDHFREYTESSILQLLSKTPFKKHEILPVALGVTGWKLFAYIHPVPEALKSLCGFWIIVLYKS